MAHPTASMLFGDDIIYTKVVIKYFGNEMLVKVNKEFGLQSTIDMLVTDLNLSRDHDYGLKLSETKIATLKTKINNYITDETFDEVIQDANYIEIDYSLDEKINTIIKQFNEPLQTDELLAMFFDLTADPAYIQMIINRNCIDTILNVIRQKNINEKGMAGCLITLLKLIQRNYVDSINQDILKSILNIVLEMSSGAEYALSVLTQIMFTKKENMYQAKYEIIDSITMSNLLKYLKYPGNLPLNAVYLMNAIIKTNKGERRDFIIRELARAENRAKFFILMSDHKICENLARQLYILQSFLFSTFHSNLSTTASASKLDMKSRSNSLVENSDDSGSDSKSRPISIGSYQENISRYSLYSVITRGSASDLPDVNISPLTNLCIEYFRSEYFKQFAISQSEENTYEPGIIITSERVVQLIADVLNITGKRRNRNCKRYIPIYFNPKTNNFFENLFIIVMILLSNARKEMRVKKLEDYDKLINVLEKQLEMILDRYPLNFEEFHKYIKITTYESVKIKQEKERQMQWERTLQSNPCIIELSKKFSLQNQPLLNEQRLCVMKEGCDFPLLLKNKAKPKRFTMKLSNNNKYISITLPDMTKKSFEISDIKYLVVGKACKYIKENYVSADKCNSVFSLILDRCEPDREINCIIDDEKKANYWIDGFNILLGKNQRSQYYNDELAVITKMDLSLHLHELQNIKIPNSPPPIPDRVPPLPC